MSFCLRYKVIKSEELKEFKKGSSQIDSNLKFASQVRLYPIQAVVVIGMMLTESKIAEQLKIQDGFLEKSRNPKLIASWIRKYTKR